MNIFEGVIQGTDSWKSIRSEHYTASEAAAAFGISKYLDRNELLKQKATGSAPEASQAKQILFDRGHLTEAVARSIAEEIIGGDLYPITANLHIEGLKLLASYDGVSFDQTIIWEHKLWSKSLADQVKQGNLEPHYTIQLDQQLLISGAEKCLFMTSDGTKENCEWMWYETTEEKKAAVVAAWKQFHRDLESYKLTIIPEKPEPAAIMQLPALSIQIKGEVTLSNLPQFKEAAEEFIAKINTDLKTDEDFATAEATVKFCDETERKLEAAKEAAIGQTASIDELMRTIDHIKEQIRGKRLTLDKLVKSQKENIKTSIIKAGFDLCYLHVSQLQSEFSKINFEQLATSVFTRQNFESACRSKRTLASLHNAVDTEVAAIKIKLDDLARVIRKNLTHLPEDLSLFRDLQSIITKTEEDFALLVEHRLFDQKRKEEEAKERAIAEATERMQKVKEMESTRIATLPTDIKSVLADEKKQADILKSEAVGNNVVEFAHPIAARYDKGIVEAIDSLYECCGKRGVTREIATEVIDAIIRREVKNVQINF